jgi:hypothetical protein
MMTETWLVTVSLSIPGIKHHDLRRFSNCLLAPSLAQAGPGWGVRYFVVQQQTCTWNTRTEDEDPSLMIVPEYQEARGTVNPPAPPSQAKAESFRMCLFAARIPSSSLPRTCSSTSSTSPKPAASALYEPMIEPLKGKNG